MASKSTVVFSPFVFKTFSSIAGWPDLVTASQRARQTRRQERWVSCSLWHVGAGPPCPLLRCRGEQDLQDLKGEAEASAAGRRHSSIWREEHELVETSLFMLPCTCDKDTG